MNEPTPSAPARDAEVLIDVRPMPPRDRHPTIFGRWEELPDGGAILLVNDHDPLPLYYQFAVEYAGNFHWEYLDRGPELWRVRIRRGTFADPGFRPVPGARGNCRPASVPIAFVQPLILDVRPVLAAGESPCGPIDEAMARLIPGQSFVLLVPFEPLPLYAKLGRCGFTHASQCQPDGTWRVEFTPGPGAEKTPISACGCHEQ